MMRNILLTALALVLLSLFVTPAQQTPSGDLNGNWAARNVNNTDGIVRSTYFNLKYEDGKITGTIRATQFFYTIKE
ncbi:MAG TPA: hypothetical protein VF075_06960, partial [Pyrinomonadaceae bacterium]